MKTNEQLYYFEIGQRKFRAVSAMHIGRVGLSLIRRSTTCKWKKVWIEAQVDIYHTTNRWSTRTSCILPQNLEAAASPAASFISHVYSVQSRSPHLFASWDTVSILVVSPGLTFCHGCGLDLVQTTGRDHE